MTYNEALSYLTSLSSFGIKPGLSRITALLNKLGNPQHDFKSVHIAGTNGKGSVTVMIGGILQAANLKTGLFTSPHLVQYTERIKINGQDISRENFAAVIEETAQAATSLPGEDRPTQFEILTAAAFLWFSRQKVDYAVIETGMGGLLDSTNVITPVISVITNVTFDHAAFCGGTPEGIAEHKAGIIKEGIPVITAAKDMALSVIRKKARELSADLFVLGEDFTVSIKNHLKGLNQEISFSSDLLGIHDFTCELSLLGVNQGENAALAIMTCAVMHNGDERITEQGTIAALAKVRHPGRFEHFKMSFQDIIIDGAHNAAGVMSLRQNLDLYYPDGQRVFVLGILADKEADTMLGELLRDGDVAITTEPLSTRAIPAETLAEKAKKCTEYVEAKPDPQQALQRAIMIAAGERPLVCAGSLYLIGSLRQTIVGHR